MNSKTTAVFLLLLLASCKSNDSNGQGDKVTKVYKMEGNDNDNPYTQIDSIPAPAGFTRLNNDVHSFSCWLRHVHLKKDKTVFLFDGTKKENQSSQFAVLDIPVGNKNLQQCADAVMHLRAAYLFDEGRYDSIVFYDNEGNAYRFSPPYNTVHFNDYLQTVFGMCGSASLSKQLKKINYKEIAPGDVLIRGGFPGHAEIVMDVITNKDGQKKYMLAQGYMPAQDIHVLLNFAVTGISPWYDVTDEMMISTPEYTFHSNEFKRW